MRQPQSAHRKTQTPIVAKQNRAMNNSQTTVAQPSRDLCFSEFNNGCTKRDLSGVSLLFLFVFWMYHKHRFVTVFLKEKSFSRTPARPSLRANRRKRCRALPPVVRLPVLTPCCWLKFIQTRRVLREFEHTCATRGGRFFCRRAIHTFSEATRRGIPFDWSDSV